MSQAELEARKKKAERGWIVAPSPMPTTAAEKVMDRARRRTPEETAISICAEIIARRTGRVAPSLRDSHGPIHAPSVAGGVAEAE
jgi:hypothetical protein